MHMNLHDVKSYIQVTRSRVVLMMSCTLIVSIVLFACRSSKSVVSDQVAHQRLSLSLYDTLFLPGSFFIPDGGTSTFVTIRLDSPCVVSPGSSGDCSNIVPIVRHAHLSGTTDALRRDTRQQTNDVSTHVLSLDDTLDSLLVSIKVIGLVLLSILFCYVVRRFLFKTQSSS